MFIIRYAQEHDLNDIYQLAEQSGSGLTTLPVDKARLLARIQRTQQTLKQRCARGDQGYFFVFEDLQQQRVVGVSAIEVAVGLTEPFYNFHVGRQVHGSKALDIYKTLDTLFLSNDLTGSSELCTLYLDPSYRKTLSGKCLSKVRFLFIAAFKTHFEQRLIAEVRGYCNAFNQSPFWDALGYHFFNMDLTTADYLSGLGQKAFIAELMPRFPIYVDLLPPEARAVIAKAHPQSEPARQVLESEGLHYRGYIDIFDAGPTLEAQIDQLRAVTQSQCLPVKIVSQPEQMGRAYLIANDQYQNYKASMAYNVIQAGAVQLTSQQAEQLDVTAGQSVRVLSIDITESV